MDSMDTLIFSHYRTGKMVISRNVRLLTRSLKSLQHYRHVTRKYATKKPEFISKFKTGKNVWILSNQNIFENLALEDWLYKYEDFQDKNLLLLWRNKPCVVIGRHQNPWAELDVTKAMQSGIEVARRSSGGGTVRHLSYCQHKQLRCCIHSWRYSMNSNKF